MEKKEEETKIIISKKKYLICTYTHGRNSTHMLARVKLILKCVIVFVCGSSDAERLNCQRS